MSSPSDTRARVMARVQKVARDPIPLFREAFKRVNLGRDILKGICFLATGPYFG
jgi:hypothetical protein